MSPKGRTSFKTRSQLSEVKWGGLTVWIHHCIRVQMGARCLLTGIMQKRLVRFGYSWQSLTNSTFCYISSMKWLVPQLCPVACRHHVWWCNCHLPFFLFFRTHSHARLSFSKVSGWAWVNPYAYCEWKFKFFLLIQTCWHPVYFLQSLMSEKGVWCSLT